MKSTKTKAVNQIDYPNPFSDTEDNVIIYCRVSSDEQGEYGASLGTQKELLTNFGKRNGYNIVMEVQESRTAKHYNITRPLLKQVFEFCKANKRKKPRLLFLKWDRFSRCLEFATKYIRIMRDNWHLELNSVENYVDFNNPDWSTFIGIYCGSAQAENAKISQRTKDGIHGKLEEGRCAGRAPRGYINKQEMTLTEKLLLNTWQ